jgi:hypothetical protein
MENDRIQISESLEDYLEATLEQESTWTRSWLSKRPVVFSTNNVYWLFKKAQFQGSNVVTTPVLTRKASSAGVI